MSARPADPAGVYDRGPTRAPQHGPSGKPVTAQARSIVCIDDVEIRLDDTWASSAVREAMHDGSYEHAERSILAATLSPNDAYLELGAGVGLLATLAGRIVAPRTVIAFEADPTMTLVAARRRTATASTRISETSCSPPTPSPEPLLSTFERTFASPASRQSPLSRSSQYRPWMRTTPSDPPARPT